MDEHIQSFPVKQRVSGLLIGCRLAAQVSLSAATDLEMQLSVDYHGRKRGGGRDSREALEEGG